MLSLLVDEVPTPLGPVALASDGAALRAMAFEPLASLAAALRARFPAAALREEQDPQGFGSRVRAYFAGEIRALEGLPADGGGTAFQRRVWAELRRIAPGETCSYGELAARLGIPRASRAVGLANARNPVALAVPCHRVIGADGRLTGYAAGVERKRWLLAHEGAAAAPSVQYDLVELAGGPDPPGRFSASELDHRPARAPARADRDGRS